MNGGESNMKSNDTMKAVKLTSNALDSITERLKQLASIDENVPTLAYVGVAGKGPCGCKGSCEGGCTSW